MKSHCFHDLTDKLTVVLCSLITGSFTSVFFFWFVFLFCFICFFVLFFFSLFFCFVLFLFCFGKCTNHVLMVVSSARDLITSQSLCGACGLIGCCTCGLTGCCTRGLIGCCTCGLIGCCMRGLIGCCTCGLNGCYICCAGCIVPNSKHWFTTSFLQGGRCWKAKLGEGASPSVRYSSKSTRFSSLCVTCLTQ